MSPTSDRTRAVIHDWLPKPRTIPGNVWPWALPASTTQQLDLIRRLDTTQWWTPEMIQSQQLRQASALVAFAAKQVPFHAQRFAAAGVEVGGLLDMDAFRRLPILTRQDLQTGRVVADKTPRAHGTVSTNTTSGSSGIPVSVNVTAHYGRFYRALCARDHHWAGRDPHWKAAVIRRPKQELPPEGARGFGWAMGGGWAPRQSPSVMQTIALPISRQAEWLAEEQPDMLVSYPSNLGALARYCQEQGVDLDRLKHVCPVGEMLTPTALEAMRSTWDVTIRDLYSSEELGYIASQCPDGDGYHVHSESVLVEVLDADDRPCAPGEAGRLVITGLHNFASPIIRYEIRDWAEVGEPCSCGRGLPSIRRIVGRSRNMLVFPNGDRRWPLTGYMRFSEVMDIRQFQFSQKSLEEVEARLVARRPATAEDESKLAAIIQESLGHPFRISFVWMDEIPPNLNGKFEEFVSELE
jgi:phenylacetate-coenzyme A ligase PaaK-like adenylate-forming protein